MATLVFVWTPAHAWALAVVYREDFAAVDIPTLPVVTSPLRARKAIWVSALATVATAGLLVPFAGLAYLGAFLPAAALFLLVYHQFVQRGGDSEAVRAFFTSNVFLATLFVGWGVTGVADGQVAGLAVALTTVVLFAKMWAARPRLRDVRAAPGPDWTAMAERTYERVRLRVSGP